MNKRYIAIIKDTHRYMFIYAPGEESKLFCKVMEYAKSEDYDLDWNDVILFLKRMRQILRERLNKPWKGSNA